MIMLITTILMGILELIAIVYLIVAFVLFLNFLIRGYTVTVTNNISKEKKILSGMKKFWTCLGMSLLWPVILIRE